MITEEKRVCFVDEWIEVKWHPTNCKHYENLDYKKYKNKFNKYVYKIHPWHITPTSKIKVKLICPRCNKIRKIGFGKFNKAKTCLCDKCSSSIQGKLSKKDLTGKRFERLIVIEDTGKRTKNTAKAIIWLCKCDCGNYCEVTTSNLISRSTKSCGCLNLEKINERNRAKGYFIKSDHTQKEIEEYINSRKDRKLDFKWGKLSKQLRKNSCCVICKSKHNLVVHHINGYWQFPEQRYNENNLVVMCKFCHAKYHSKYNSTREGWEIYKNDYYI